MSATTLKDLNHTLMENKLKDIGMFEPGMTVDDMIKVLEVIEESEKASKEPNQYRDMPQTESIHENPNQIMSESKYTLSTVAPNDVPDFDELGIDIKNDFLENLAEESPPLQKHIDVFSTSVAMHKALMPVNINSNAASPIYCQIKSLEMSPQETTELIYDYHVSRVHQFKHAQRNSIHTIPWGNFRIEAEITNNAEDTDSTESNDRISEYETNFEKTPTDSQTKRKISNDESDTPNKKLKVDIGVSTKSSPVSTGVNRETTSSASKRSILSNTNESIKKRSKLFSDIIHNNNNNRTNKIFDELKKQILAKPAPLTEEEILRSPEPGIDESSKPLDSDDLNSSDDEIFPTIKTVAVVHNVKTPVKNDFSALINKPTTSQISKLSFDADSKDTTEESQLKASKNNGVEEEIVSFQIQKKRKVDDTHNLIENSMDCPLCGKMFPMSIIEKHASECLTAEDEKYFVDNNTDVENIQVCNICNQYLPGSVNLTAHITDCMEKQFQNKKKIV